MNRRKFLTFAAALLPCSFVARMIGEKDLHGTPSPAPTEEYKRVWQCAVQTPNLNSADDETIVKEFEKLNKAVEWLLASAKKEGREIQDIKFYWRNIWTSNGMDKFVRVIMRACDPKFPVVFRGIKI